MGIGTATKIITLATAIIGLLIKLKDLKDASDNINDSGQIQNNNFPDMTNDELATYIPNVYQNDIFDIDYDLLMSNGKKLFSIDIDETVVALVKKYKKKGTIEGLIELVSNLKSNGAKVILLTRLKGKKAEELRQIIGADGCVERSEKSNIKSLEKVLKNFGSGYDKSNMVHIGSSMCSDVKPGNDFGITTCLVRDLRVLAKMGHKLKKTRGHYLRKELRFRLMWHKHHQNEKNDQYYQFGGKQFDSPNFPQFNYD